MGLPHHPLALNVSGFLTIHYHSDSTSDFVFDPTELMKYKSLLAAALVASSCLLGGSKMMAQRSIPIRVERWLAIQQIEGIVTYRRDTVQKAAQIGDRLEWVGDSLSTGKNSTATLLVDTGVGTINMSENTILRVQSLSMASDNGRITRLEVPQGRVYLKLRRFTHPGSRLEIKTPSGLSGVRGTEFGLSIQPSGKTGLATRQGAVVASASGADVRVTAGYQNFTVSGEPPSIPVPLKNDPSLRYQVQQEIDSQRVRRFRLIGQTDSVNALTVDGVAQSTDREGRFSALFYASSYPRVKVVVTTPLGKTETYELALE